MRDAIAWSHDLLTAEEQLLFPRLAVFVGGFDLEAAEVVATAAGDLGVDPFDGVASLVDASLLRQEPGAGAEPRFGMLETVREYALERLAASGEEEAVRDAHAAWCLDLSGQAALTWFTGAQGRWVARLAAEHDNLRATLAWLVQTGNAEAGVRLVGWLAVFWFVRGHWAEGRGWLERAVGWSAGSRTVERVSVLNSAALFAQFRGDGARAAALAEESLAVAEELGDVGIHTPLSTLAIVAMFRGDYDRARHLMEAALAAVQAHAETVPNAAALATSMLGDLANIAFRQGDSEARRLAEECLTRQRALGDAWGASESLFLLALLAYDQGETAEAAAFCRESLALAWAERNLQRVAFPLDRLAILAGEAGQDEAAARLFGAAERLHEALGLARDAAVGAGRARALATARARSGEEAFAAAWAAGRALPVEGAVAEAARLEVGPVVPTSRPPTATAAEAGLTRREREVLRLLVGGHTDREIAAALCVSPRTVGGHVSHILAKFGVETRRGARDHALRHGLV
jgi:non-specific serine/threonine protein kinase